MTILLIVGTLAFAPQPARWIAMSLSGAAGPAMLLGTRSSMEVLEGPVAVTAPPPARP